ncbi:hypothetical protein HCEG_03915 [Histoplasma capsulatum var. duboisii H88]|uniref:Uncharacterized protein n=2 Tax=Ajellomyces capsulatus TaxID=5037 RepID=F0UEH0_AJEC8|nr:predicted protein [Histoplasma capsulatum H143]EGC44700.1 hypothetical protein HCEG_03915 [Histoplasma capsulatum var. duboisii H88]
MFPQDVHKLAQAGDPLEPGLHAAAGTQKSETNGEAAGLGHPIPWNSFSNGWLDVVKRIPVWWAEGWAPVRNSTAATKGHTI